MRTYGSRALCIMVALLFAVPCLAGAEPAVVLEFFYEPGCVACAAVERELLPQIDARYGDLLQVRRCPVSDEAQYLRLLAYLDRCGVTDNASVFMVVNGRECLAGLAAMQEHLIARIDQHVSQGIQPTVLPAQETEPGTAAERLERRMATFTLGGVLIGGLIDGVNPCAFAALVFLLSVLGMAGVSGGGLVRIGAVFCLGSFLTYTALGLGLLGALHLLEQVAFLRRLVEWGMVLVLIGFAAASLHDAVVFARRGHAREMFLRLPARLQQRVHRVVRSRLGRRAGLPTVFAVAVVVTGLESICTGQVYVPTLALVVRSGENSVRALGYLLLYNAMFVLPLAVTVLLAAGGVQWTRVAAWSRRHVVPAKIVLAGFFLVLAGVMGYISVTTW